MKTFASMHSCTKNNLKEHSLNEGNAKHCFARVQDESYARINVIEHTPIYNLDEYNHRQRKIKRQRLLKNLTDTAIFISIAGLTFSTLFWGVQP